MSRSRGAPRIGRGLFLSIPVYYTVLVGRCGQRTMGTVALRRTVVDTSSESETIDHARAFARSLVPTCRASLFVPGIVDDLWPLSDARNET